MIGFGNNIEIAISKQHREKTRIFYVNILNCEMVTYSPSDPDSDVFRFPNGYIIGMLYTDECLTESEFRKAPWFEILTDNPIVDQKRIREFGVTELDDCDDKFYFFHAPGGPVFRLVSKQSVDADLVSQKP